jgi:hypothetical protein
VGHYINQLFGKVGKVMGVVEVVSHANVMGFGKCVMRYVFLIMVECGPNYVRKCVMSYGVRQVWAQSC